MEDVFGTSVDISSSQQATTITHTQDAPVLCHVVSHRNGISQGEQVQGSD